MYISYAKEVNGKIKRMNIIYKIGMKMNKILLFVAATVALLTSCGGGQQGLPTSDEYPVITIGASNAQLKTTYPATLKGVQDVEGSPKGERLYHETIRA